MSTATLPSILPTVIALVKQAGAWLADEFSRPDGPRFSHTDSAPIDTEIELFLRDGLTALLPARFVGEEEGVLAAEANGFCWVVDPHDGTRAFLEGRRGSAVSVGLLRQGVPVLGVVYAPTGPDRGPDMIAWAEGCPITRNGVPVSVDLRQRDLAANEVVFLNHGAGQRPVWNSAACAPARFMPLPSIAYRLARVAVGDGIATVTLRPVNAHDIAAGHALLTAAGGVLVAEDGVEVTYGEHGDSRPFACFGGAPAAVATLRARTWRGSSEPRREPKVTLTWPRIGEGQRFDRALGCMMGMVIADSGSQALAGQPGDGAELAIALARSLVRIGGYDPDAAAGAYARWQASLPLAARGDAVGYSALLARAAPIAVWARDADEAAQVAGEDCALSHPHPVCRTACACLAAAISTALAGADRRAMLASALRVADAGGPVADAAGPDAAAVAVVLRAAEAGATPTHHDDPVLSALHRAFFHLAAGCGLSDVVDAGSSDAAAMGALLGAADGRAAMPVRLLMPVLTCRPDPDLHPARPRPDEYWPDDLLDLTEALLLSRAPP